MQPLDILLRALEQRGFLKKADRPTIVKVRGRNGIIALVNIWTEQL
jgi:hypothetical protein